MNRKNMEILFLLILMAVTVTIAVRSMVYTLKTYLLPVLVGIPIFILMIVQIVREMSSKEEPSSASREKKTQGSGVFAAASLLGFILLIYLIGFLVAIPVGVFGYILVSREKWYLALGLSLAMLLVVFVLQHLGLYLYEGLLLS